MTLRRLGARGQATTEVVLLFPLFMFFLFAFAKVFALLVLVQKIEIASFYAARRWQLESHRNVAYEADDQKLKADISEKVLSYIGYGTPAGNFLDLTDSCRRGGTVGVDVERTQVWQVVSVTVCTKGLDMAFYKSPGFQFEVTKYVPNRDRPIAFILPGMQ